MDIEEIGIDERTGFCWLMIGSSGGILWPRCWTCGFSKKGWYFLTRWVTISFSNNILHHGVSKVKIYVCGWMITFLLMIQVLFCGCD
jgi:hypothetical protein